MLIKCVPVALDIRIDSANVITDGVQLFIDRPLSLGIIGDFLVTSGRLPCQTCKVADHYN